MKPHVRRLLAGLVLSVSVALLGRAAEAVAPVSVGGREAVQARYDHGRTLERGDRPAEALAEYLWCYDTGMVAEESFAGVRNSFLLSSIAQLGAGYPPALEALRERRDRAEIAMKADATNRRAALDFASLNGALNENGRTLAVFDSLPVDDPRRGLLLVRVYDLLVKDHRYDDAIRARPLEKLEQAFAMNVKQLAQMAAVPRPAGRPDPFPGYVVRNTVASVEVLIGAGETDAAKSLAKRLLEQVDGSAATKKLMGEAAARAGHPGVFSAEEGKALN